MAKLEVLDDAPSAELIREAKKEAVVTDARGRKIRLVKPAVLAQFKIVKILGEAAANQTYMSMVFPLLFVAAIDDDVMFFPTKEIDIEALINRLDEDGIAAVMQGVQDNFAAVDQEAAAAAVKP